MSFPIPRPKATPGPSPKPRKYVRGEVFDATTQAIFGRKRLANITIENAEQGRASTERRRAVAKASI